MTDTARFADIVLPATTQLEQHDIMFSWGHFYLSSTAGHRAARRGGAQHGAVPAAAAQWASTTRTSSGATSRWRSISRLVGPATAGHHHGAAPAAGFARLSSGRPIPMRRTPRGTSRRRPASASSSPRWRPTATSSCRCSARVERVPGRDARRSAAPLHPATNRGGHNPALAGVRTRSTSCPRSTTRFSTRATATSRASWGTPANSTW